MSLFFSRFFFLYSLMEIVSKLRISDWKLMLELGSGLKNFRFLSLFLLRPTIHCFCTLPTMITDRLYLNLGLLCFSCSFLLLFFFFSLSDGKKCSFVALKVSLANVDKIRSWCQQFMVGHTFLLFLSYLFWS